MKQTIVNLRDGQYGNKHKLSAIAAADPNILVKPSGCGLLAEHAIKMAKSQFIAMCPDLSRLIGTLWSRSTHR